MTRLSFCGFLWVVHLTSTSRSPAHPQLLWETLGSRFEPLEKVGDLLVDLLSLTHLALDFLHGVDHRRVIAASEEPGDTRIAQIGQISEHVHGDLPGGHERPLARLAPQRVDLEPEDLRDL